MSVLIVLFLLLCDIVGLIVLLPIDMSLDRFRVDYVYDYSLYYKKIKVEQANIQAIEIVLIVIMFILIVLLIYLFLRKGKSK